MKLLARSLTLFICAFTTQTSAAVKTTSTLGDFNCLDLRKAAMKLETYSANIINRATTRTPEGGAYKRVDLKCKDLYCESIKQEDFKLVHEPGHPDANKDGFVQYPVVDVAREFAAMNTAASEVRLLASKEYCGAKAILSATSALIKYDHGASLQSDTFNFTVDGRLTSWSRVTRDGTTLHYAFNPDGTIAKSAQ